MYLFELILDLYFEKFDNLIFSLMTLKMQCGV